MMSVTKHNYVRSRNESIFDYRYVKNVRGGRSVFQFISLVFSTILYNFFRLYFSFVGINRPTSEHVQINNLLILGFGGIGNHLLLFPVIKALRSANPTTHISVVTSSSVSAQLFKNNPDIATVLVVNQKSRSKFINTLITFGSIRKLKPDAVLTASGTNPVTGGLLSFLCDAKIRVGEDWHGRGWLYTDSIKADQANSEMEQNYKLARFLNAAGHKRMPKLYLSAEEIKWGQDWLQNSGLRSDCRKIGIHPGCGKSQMWKRWGIERFLKVAMNLRRGHNIEAVFF